MGTLSKNGLDHIEKVIDSKTEGLYLTILWGWRFRATDTKHLLITINVIIKLSVSSIIIYHYYNYF